MGNASTSFGSSSKNDEKNNNSSNRARLLNNSTTKMYTLGDNVSNCKYDFYVLYGGEPELVDNFFNTSIVQASATIFITKTDFEPQAPSAKKYVLTPTTDPKTPIIVVVYDIHQRSEKGSAQNQVLFKLDASNEIIFGIGPLTPLGNKIYYDCLTNRFQALTDTIMTKESKRYALIKGQPNFHYCQSVFVIDTNVLHSWVNTQNYLVYRVDSADLAQKMFNSLQTQAFDIFSEQTKLTLAMVDMKNRVILFNPNDYDVNVIPFEKKLNVIVDLINKQYYELTNGKLIMGIDKNTAVHYDLKTNKIEETVPAGLTMQEKTTILRGFDSVYHVAITPKTETKTTETVAKAGSSSSSSSGNGNN